MTTPTARPDVDKLVKRLRDAFNPEYWTSEIRTEAADEIERLEAQIAAKNATIKKLREQLREAKAMRRPDFTCG